MLRIAFNLGFLILPIESFSLVKDSPFYQNRPQQKNVIYKEGNKIILSRDKLIKKLKSLSAIKHQLIGALLTELTTSKLFIRSAISKKSSHDKIETNYFASTEPVSGAPTIFSEMALKLDLVQLQGLQIQKALERILTTDQLQNKGAVALVVTVLVAPHSTPAQILRILSLDRFSLETP
jgi:hypothetical protein